MRLAVTEPFLDSPQQPDERKENDERQEEERDTSIAMQSAVRDEAWVHIVCEQGESDNAKSILNDRKRYNHRDQPQLSPRGSEKEMPGHQTGNTQ